MNQSLTYVLSMLVLLTTSVLGSLSDQAAKEADLEREGNLPELVKTYYVTKVDKHPKSCGKDFNQVAASPDYRVLRLEGYSGFDQEVLSYTSTYLVTKSCFNGATHRGAGRSVVENVVIQATRTGVISPDGEYQTSKPETFKVLRSIDPALFAAQYGQ